MSYCIEELDKATSRFNDKGLLEATRHFYVDSGGSDGILVTSGSPYDAIPDLWEAYSVTYPLLIVVNREITRDEEGLGWFVVCQYSTELASQTVMNVQMSFSAEALDTTRYTKWMNAGTIVDIPIATVYPLLEMTLSYRREYAGGWTPDVDRQAIFNNTGKLNDRKFYGFEKETLLFEGAETDADINFQGVAIRAATTYKFLHRARSQNEAFREARQQLNASGEPQYWSDDPTAPYPVSGDHKVGDPVLVSDPVAGKSDWDRPYWLAGDPASAFYRYELADFGYVLNIPPLSGDDPITPSGAP